MNSIHQLLSSVRGIVVIIFIVLITTSYHPTIVDISRASGYESGTILSRYITWTFSALFAISLSVTPLKSRFIKNYIILLLPIVVVALLVIALYNNGIMTNAVRDITLCFLAILIGWDLNFNKTYLENTLLFFSLMVLSVGVVQVMTNIGGFVIKNQYLVDAKNSLGVLLATSVISMLIVWRSTDRSFIRFIAFVSSLLGIIIILTIRARAALLAVFLVGLIVFLKSSRGKTFTVTMLALFVLLFISLPFLPDVAYNYIYDSIFAGTQGDDISSGRFSTYQYAITYLLEGNHLWFGDVNQTHDLGHWIHNYLLLQVYRYGIVFSLPLLVFYIYLVFFIIKHSFHISNPLFECGYALVCILIIISLLEPTFPFSPGTATLFNFIILGSSLNYSFSNN